MVITKQYIAGFFDGEGSIGIYKNSNKKQQGFFLRTQLTQNKGKEIEQLMNCLKNKYGGNLSEQKTLSRRIKYNWQLNSNSASNFLKYIVPHLILKKSQALLAIYWQGQRPVRIRDKNGRITLKTPANLKLDIEVSKIMKQLKIKDIDEVMENAKDLVSIEATLKQILNVKGD